MRFTFFLAPMMSFSCVELVKVLEEELENGFGLVANDSDGNGITDVHESVLTITKNATPVNRGGIYGDSDDILCAINSYREVVCIHDFLSAADSGLLTDNNSAVLGTGLKSITKVRGWTADERTTPPSFAPFVAGLTEYGNVFTNYWGAPEDEFWQLSSGRHLYVTHGSYNSSSSYNPYPNGQLTLQSNAISILYEGSEEMESVLHNQTFRQLDQLSFQSDNVIYAGVDSNGDAAFGAYNNSTLGLPNELTGLRVLQTEIFATAQENVRFVQAAIDEFNQLVLWQNDDPQYGPEPVILSGYEQISSSGVAYGRGYDSPGYLCGVKTDQSLSCIELIWDEVSFEYVWNPKLVPTGSFLQVEVEEDLVCAIRSDRSVDCWVHDAPQNLVTIPNFTSIGF